MKRILSIFCVVLVGLFFLLSVLDYNSEYVAEKTLWGINKDFERLMKDPEFVPGTSFDVVAKSYEDFILHFKDSKLRSVASLHLGEVYISKKDYFTARKHLETVVKKYFDQPKIAAEAIYNIAEIYILEEDFVNALLVYRRLLKEYPLTEKGLQAPLLIAQFYARENNMVKARESFDEAIAYYQKLAVTYSGTQTELEALRLSASSLLAQNRWREAVEVLGEELYRLAKYRQVNTSRVNTIVRLINTISITKVKDLSLAIGIYKKFIEENKNHPLNSILKEMVENLEGLHNKNVSKKVKI
jgi:TolA-binding protein